MAILLSSEDRTLREYNQKTFTTHIKLIYNIILGYVDNL